MVKKAEETALDSALIDAAITAVAAEMKCGSFASRDLVKRMAEEERFVQCDPGTEAKYPHAARLPHSFTLAAAVEERALAGEALERLLISGCTDASLLHVPRAVMLVEFSVETECLDGAIRSAAGAIAREFPSAVFFEPCDPNAFLDALVEVETGESVSLVQLQQLLAVPQSRRWQADPESGDHENASDGAVTTYPRREVSSWIEGIVFEVFQEQQVAHVRASDRRIFSLTPRTPGLGDAFETLAAGHRFRCLVGPRFNIVRWAERIDDAVR